MRKMTKSKIWNKIWLVSPLNRNISRFSSKLKWLLSQIKQRMMLAISKKKLTLSLSNANIQRSYTMMKSSHMLKLLKIKKNYCRELTIKPEWIMKEPLRTWNLGLKSLGSTKHWLQRHAHSNSKSLRTANWRTQSKDNSSQLTNNKSSLQNMKTCIICSTMNLSWRRWHSGKRRTKAKTSLIWIRNWMISWAHRDMKLTVSMHRSWAIKLNLLLLSLQLRKWSRNIKMSCSHFRMNSPNWKTKTRLWKSKQTTAIIYSALTARSND